MAARVLQLRRALSILSRNQPQNRLFKEQSCQFFPSSNAFFSSGDFYKRLFGTQANPTTLTDDIPENNDSTASNSASELTNGPSSITSTEDLDVKHKVVSNLKINARHDFMMIFTCKVCETRSVKMACRESYEKGVVVARCPGCNNLHLIADRLGWFGEPGSIEDFLSDRGEEVKRDSLDSLNLTLEDLAGTKVLNK